MMDQDKNKATNSFDNRETFIAARDALDRGETDEAMKLYMKLSEFCQIAARPHWVFPGLHFS